MICSGTASLPMSCKRAAARRASISSSAEVHFVGQFNGVGAHPLQVRVRRVILGFNGECERLDRTHVQGCDLFDVALFDFHAFLLRFEPPRYNRYER